MANKKKTNIGGKLLLFVLELVVAVAILFFAAKFLPKDMTITSIGSEISQSLLITTPEPDPTPEATEIVSETPAPDPVILITPAATQPAAEEAGEVGLTGEEPTGSGAEEETDGESVTGTESENTSGEGELLIEETTGEAASTEAEQNETIAEEQADLSGEEGQIIVDASTETEQTDPVSDEVVPTEAPVVTAPPTKEPELVSTARTATITISAAGDCTLGGDAVNGGLRRFEKVFDEYGEEYFLQNVKAIFEGDDLTIVNLEGALTGETARKDKQFSFKGDPRFGKILSSSSVEVVSIDNNHSQDYYSQGLADTKKTLDYLGIGYAGLGSVYTTMIDGINVGCLSYRVWDMDVDTMAAEIKALKEECELVIVSIHWGEEKVGKANATQIKLGHAAVDAGADLVLGHHPHVVGSIEVYNGKYIVYSLGNFCFGGNGNPADKDTFIFQQTFTLTEGEIAESEIKIVPCSVSSADDTNNYQPTPLPYHEGGKDIMKRIIKLSQQFESVPDWEAILADMEAEAAETK